MKFAPLLLVWLTLGLAQAPQPGWELTGIVTYNGRPAKGAWVRLEGSSTVKPVNTDGQGRYSLQDDTPGLYTVTAIVDGDTIEQISRSLTLVAGGHLKADFSTPKGGVLSGRVLDRDKHPVPGIFVGALSKTVDPAGVHLRPVDEDRTNDLGEYRIPHLPPDVYVLSVSARTKPPKLQKKGAAAAPLPGSDYPLRTFYPGTTMLDGAQTVELHSGEEQSSLDIVVQKQTSRCVSFQIVGNFYAWSDLDHPFTGVTLEPFLGPSVTAVPSEIDGEFRANELSLVCGVVAGGYRLNLLTNPGERVVRTIGYRSVLFTLKDENVDLGSLEIAPPVETRGTVSVQGVPDDATLPAGIRVRLISTESFWLSHDDGGIAPVQPDRTFKAPRVFPSDYAVRLYGLPAGYYVIDVEQQGRSVRDGGLKAGSGDLHITLGTDGASVSGRVLAEDGTAIADASVLLAPRGSGRPLVVQSDQNGVFRIAAGVCPGDYRIAAIAGLLESQRANPAVVTKLAAGGTDLTLGARESRTLDLKPLASR